MSLLLDDAGTARRIVLAPPAAAALAVTQATRDKRDQIGIGRDLPSTESRILLSELDWQPVGGVYAAQIRITSQSAAALRVALRPSAGLPPMMLRVAGTAPGATVFGPIALADVAAVAARFGEWWTPVTRGESVTLELATASPAALGSATIEIARLSHLVRTASLAKTVNPGGSAACEVNWVCEPRTPALVAAAAAVGLMTFTQQDGGTFNCTGTLLNDSKSSNTPYFFTAHHCIDGAYAAQTLNVVWGYDALACDASNDNAPYTDQNGALLLASSLAEDWALVRLNDVPPPAAMFSAWNATPITSGAVIDLHHPRADLKKYSAGNIVPGPAGGYVHYVENADDGSAKINALMPQVVWNTGVTEGGSSGSGLLTLNPGGYYEVRGGLYGGGSSCSAPKDPDFFSRMDRMLPLTRGYLAPGTMSSSQAIVVEYYNRTLDHYFMTALQAEIDILDSGALPGWERTGLRFVAWTAPTSGAVPVCRFYRPPPFVSTHFYSAIAAECQALVDHPDQFPGWVEESPAVFYVQLPDSASGACAAGTRALWRFYHATVVNHRYTTDVSVHVNLRNAAGWVPEGYGPDAVAMCVPEGS